MEEHNGTTSPYTVDNPACQTRHFTVVDQHCFAAAANVFSPQTRVYTAAVDVDVDNQHIAISALWALTSRPSLHSLKDVPTPCYLVMTFPAPPSLQYPVGLQMRSRHGCSRDRTSVDVPDRVNLPLTT
jgi:hypothetical protein